MTALNIQIIQQNKILSDLPAPFIAQEEGEEEEEKEEKEEKKKDAFALSVSKAPARLQTSTQPKRAQGPTLDHRAMHEGKQIQPKRGKGAK